MRIKKFIIFLIVLLFAFSIVSCKKKDNGKTIDPTPDVDPKPVTPTETELTKHLILDSDGNYGGTYNKDLYGEGTPLNGEYDIPNTQFYSIINYWNRGATNTRTLYKNFKPYQKTMANTDGIACLVSLLNYFDYDTADLYSEFKLMEKYNNLNTADLSKEDCTTDGLYNLVSDLGLSCEKVLKADAPAKENITEWIKTQLSFGNFILLPNHDGTSGWCLIVGADDMGTTSTSDDVVIMMDPNDVLDHYQDGWKTEAADFVHTWWSKTLQNGFQDRRLECILVSSPQEFNYQEKLAKTEDITISVSQPDCHIPVQPDGKIISNYYTTLFNSFMVGKDTTLAKYTTAKNRNMIYTKNTDAEFHHSDSYYYKKVDFYSFKSDLENGYYFCSGFVAHQQNMPSTCGICSMVNIMNYYGYDTMCEDSEWSEAQVAYDFQQAANAKIQGTGIGASNANKLLTSTKYAEEFKVLGYGNKSAKGDTTVKSTDNITLIYKTYDEFATLCRGKLDTNTPIAVSWRPSSGHWTVIIGFMDMGDDNPYNDIIVMGDSNDVRDHSYDGYNIYPAMTFYSRWFNGSHSLAQAHYIFQVK